ncbi:hypothetical protein CEP51_015698 [Fusarium floridanum]|uniref:Uncharacterized protein n=1 Tax=Fusarium floridanum TaxID=1325733 RepID=A0A428P4N4_9HYPO|nr:hypothetical protein CEP51_015698 [Fusarium floridanum]
MDISDEDDGDDENDDDELQDQPRFDRLAQKAESLLRRIEAHRLQSFSWDLGTCVPPEILGVNGVVPLRQSSLQSLSLITDPTCRDDHDAECEIDLSSFCKLQSLSWRGPNSDNLDALTVALRSNSTHLRELELDFVNWPELREYLGYFSDDEDDMDGIKGTDYFAYAVLGLNKRSPRPLFPTIRVLFLSQVPLSAAMAHAFNFDTLTSLTLRMCPNWDQFVGRVMELNHPIKLKKLEIQESDDVTYECSEDSILDFLDAFEGLEELFVSQAGPAPALRLWDHVARRHSQLKRFVGHQRTINTDENSPNFEKPCDLPDLAIFGRDMRRIEEDPSQNPLAKLDLEFIGLACIPERLVSTRRPHHNYLKQYASWAITNHPAVATSGARSDTSSETGESLPSLPWTDSGLTTATGATEDVTFGPNVVKVAAGKNGRWRGPTLRHEFASLLNGFLGRRG